MSRRFWEIEKVQLEDGVLQIAMIELSSALSDPAPPVSIAGVMIAGNSLKIRPDSERVSIVFSKVFEFRAIPEQCSWPAYEDGIEIFPFLLYEKPGLFFYGNEYPQEYERFNECIGWVKVDSLQCYIIHSESFDIYVLSNQPPYVTPHHYRHNPQPN